MLQIDGVAVATPKSFSVTVNDLDGETNRNARGDLIRDRVAVKRKLELEWPALNNSAMSTLLTKVQNVFFSVTYPDPMTGGNVTKTFYVGDRTAPMYRNTNGVILWEGLKMNFIEK